MHLGDKLVIADSNLLQVFGKAHGVADVIDAQQDGKVAGRAHLVHAAQALFKRLFGGLQLLGGLGNGQVFLLEVAFAHVNVFLQGLQLGA